MKSRGGDYQGLALAGTAVAELVLPIFVGVWVDRNFATDPWGLVLGTTLGFVGGLTHLFIISQRSGNDGQPPSTGQDP